MYMSAVYIIYMSAVCMIYMSAVYMIHASSEYDICQQLVKHDRSYTHMYTSGVEAKKAASTSACHE